MPRELLTARNIKLYRTSQLIFTLSPVNWAYNSLQEPELQAIKLYPELCRPRIVFRSQYEEQGIRKRRARRSGGR